MATIIGKSSGYLRQQASKYYLLNLLLVFVVLAGGWLLILFSPKIVATSSLGFFITVIVFIKVVAPLIEGKQKSFKKISRRYLRGNTGEDVAEKILKQLPDEYFVFRDVVINSPGNIDFVVVGPNGVFAVEVKNHGGKITFNGSELMDNGRPIPEKNLLQQAIRQSFQVREYLEKNAGVRVFVNAMLLFTNRSAFLSVGTAPINNVRVVGPQLINQVIISNAGHINQVQIVSIVVALRKTVPK